VPSKNNMMMRINEGEYIIGKNISEPITESVWSRICNSSPKAPCGRELSLMLSLRLRKLFGNSPKEYPRPSSMPDKKELSLRGIPKRAFMTSIENPVKMMTVIKPLNVLESPKNLLSLSFRWKSIGLARNSKRWYLIIKKWCSNPAINNGSVKSTVSFNSI